MSLPPRVTHEFVDLIPAEREPGKVYISIRYATATHDCLCGCGQKVVTPIKPNKWTLTYDGEAISLSPSIGNWSFPCRSHYWINGGRVVEAGQMSAEAIAYGRGLDAALTERHYGQPGEPTSVRPQEVRSPPAKPPPPTKRGIWGWLFGGE